MSYDPGSPVTLVDDLPRAVAYGQWASKFSNANPPDGLTEYGAWGHVARWLAQKGGADLTLRGTGVAVPNLLTQALLVEPSKHLGIPEAWTTGFTDNPLGANARGGQRTLRGMLLWGVNQSDDKLVESWTSNPVQLAQTVARTIETDPDPLVRLEALKLLSVASYPVNRWATTNIPAIERAQAVLAETAWDPTTRRALQKWLSDAKSRLLTLLATQGLPLLPGGDKLAPPRALVNWKLWGGLAAGAVAASLIGVAMYRRRRARALPA